MTYTITSECIRCQRCLTACPAQAIATNGTTFWIESDRCNQCEGTHGVPQCWAVCPTNEGCVPLASGAVAVPLSSGSETSPDYWESWFAKYTRMVGRLQDTQQSPYWQQWFDVYSRSIQQLQTQTSF
ncbi:MAG: 4Fe-4S binding protein [Leptolyngbyaceae cyanobacterium]